MNSNYNRFFIPTPVSTGQFIELPDYVINKLVNTLRQKQGDKIRIFNGDKEFLATISELETRKIKIMVGEELTHINDSPLKLHLFQCVLKNHNMDLVIQKSPNWEEPISHQFYQKTHWLNYKQVK